MKYHIKFTNQFKRSYKLAKKRGLNTDLLDEVVVKLQKGERLDPKYKDHALQGALNGFRECHIRPNWLLIYLIEDAILTLTLVNTGTHADLFDL